MNTSTLDPRVAGTRTLRPIVEWVAAGEWKRVPSDSAAMRPGLPVVCQDGTAGRFVQALYNSPGHAPTAIVVRRGFIRKRDYVVPCERIVVCDSQEIVLDLSKRELACQPLFRSDDEIVDGLKRAFHAPIDPEDYRAFLHISTSVCAGVVELTGNVRNSMRRQQAERIAGAVPGVLDVRNRLVVDDELADAVDHTLKRSHAIAINGLHVDVFLGLVHLRGSVSSSDQRDLATSIASAVDGVQAINNALHVERSCLCGATISAAT